MKKVLLLISIILAGSIAFTADWVPLFEKSAIDISSIKADNKTKIVSFWVKSKNKQKDIKYPDVLTGKKIPILYTVQNMEINCKTQMSRTTTLAMYDKNDRLLDQADNVTEWSKIIPDTYADAYYRLFCLIDFKNNPFTNGEIAKERNDKRNKELGF